MKIENTNNSLVQNKWLFLVNHQMSADNNLISVKSLNSSKCVYLHGQPCKLRRRCFISSTININWLCQHKLSLNSLLNHRNVLIEYSVGDWWSRNQTDPNYRRESHYRFLYLTHKEFLKPNHFTKKFWKRCHDFFLLVYDICQVSEPLNLNDSQ